MLLVEVSFRLLVVVWNSPLASEKSQNKINGTFKREALRQLSQLKTLLLMYSCYCLFAFF